MKYQSISVEWASNGRVLPTQAEREDIQSAMHDAAEAVAKNCLTARAIEIRATEELVENAEKYGWQKRAAKRLLADAIVSVTE